MFDLTRRPSFRPSRAYPLLLSLLMLAGAPRVTAQAVAALDDPRSSPLRGCATHRLVTDLTGPREDPRDVAAADGEAAGMAGLARVQSVQRVQAATRPGRTYVTPHFALHYTLAPTTNRPRWDLQSAPDRTLKGQVDSLLASLSGLTGAPRDSTLHARLDALGATHPRYIIEAGEHFERAWRYYDSLGMRMPDSSHSRYFKVPVFGRMAVDVADIGTVLPSYNGPYYGLAFPPENGYESSLLIENDFRYNAVYDPVSGQSTGTPIRSLHNGQTYRDYTIDWEMGLSVTAVHEFYHSVQYQYTPSLAGYHAWYELSATGMEERLAPEVNDYFQYLPYTLQRHHDIPLTTASSLANYGNAIFHVYLTHKLGEGFDAIMWEHLADTNNLFKAWIKTAGSQGAWDTLFNDYAAALSIAGTPGAATSSLAFSPDMAQWPAPQFDTTPAAGGNQLDIPSLTFRLVRAPSDAPGTAVLLEFTESRRVDSSATGYQSVSLNTNAVTVGRGQGVTRSTSVFTHSGSAGTRRVLLTRPGASLSVTRNPVKRDQGPVFLLAPAEGTQDSLQVVSESGRRVVTVPVDPSGKFWSWDLRESPDSNARVVPAGLYWLRSGQRPPVSLLVLP